MKYLICIILTCTYFSLAFTDDYKDGMKAYKEGNKIEALEFFIGKVTEKPDHQKSVDMIKQLLPEVIEMRKTKAKKYEEQGKWAEAQKEYDRLRRLDNVLQSLFIYDNKQQLKLPKIDVAQAQEAAKDNAAERYYLQGVEAMKTIGNAETAANFFKEARKFDPDYKDSKELSAQAFYNDGLALINAKEFKDGVKVLWKIHDFFPEGFKDSEVQIQTAIDSAKVKVAVMSFDDLTFKTNYGNVGSNLSSEIIANGVSRKPVFIDFVTRDYVHSLLSEQSLGASGAIDASTAAQIGKLIGIDVFVFGKITAINPNYPEVKKVSGESKAYRRNYDTNTTYTIHANWTKFTRIGEVTVSANYQIVDVKTGRIIDSKSISRTASSIKQWVTYTGDEEALERSVLDHNTTGDESVDSPDVLTSQAIQQISYAIATNILKFYEDFDD